MNHFQFNKKYFSLVTFAFTRHSGLIQTGKFWERCWYFSLVILRHQHRRQDGLVDLCVVVRVDTHFFTAQMKGELTWQ